MTAPIGSPQIGPTWYRPLLGTGDQDKPNCANCGRAWRVHWPDDWGKQRWRCPEGTGALKEDHVDKPEDYRSDSAFGSLALAARDSGAFWNFLVGGIPLWAVFLLCGLGPLGEHPRLAVAAVAVAAILWWLAWWRIGIGAVRVPTIWEAAAGLLVCAGSLPFLLLFGRKTRATPEELRARLRLIEAEIERADAEIQRHGGGE